MTRIQDRFELREVLGTGGCGKVMLALDRETDRQVALKLLNAKAKEAPRLFQRFVREGRALARIEHPHVTGVVAADYESETPWLALEYVAGEDLEHRLRRAGPYPVEAAWVFARQLCEALTELHRHGIIHRDLKPANLMLRGDTGEVVVTDLGLAAMADATVVTETGELFGTPLYLPPEVVKGHPWTTQGDVYQAGAVLFEVLTGRRLVSGQGMAQVMSNVVDGRHEDFPPASAVPEAIRQVIREAVHVDPDRRISSPEALIQALDRARRGGGGPGAATRALDRLDAAALGGAPGRVPGGMPLSRILPALLLVGAGIGFFAGNLLGARPPDEVLWQVVGDALVVSYRAPGRQDIRLVVGADRLAPEPGEVGGRRRILVRGLSQTDETRARLVWDGGESAPYQAFAQPPAVLGTGGAAPDGGLLLRAERGCEAWWEDTPAVRFRLQKGATGVPVTRPLPAALTLVWEELGLRFTRAFPRREVLRGVAEELLRYGGVPDWRPVLEARLLHRSDTTGSGFRAEREPWRRALPWIADVLEEELPPGMRRDVFAALSEWQTCVLAEQLLGDDPPGLDLEKGRAGSMFPSRPPGPTLAVPAEYEPVDVPTARKEHEPNRVQMIAREHQNNPGLGGRALDNAALVEMTWPALPESASPVHCLTLDSDRLKSWYYFEVGLRGGAEPVALRYFHPGVLALDTPKLRGPVTRCYPAIFSPPAGTRLRLEVRPLMKGAFDFAGVRGVEVHVPATGSGEP